MVRGLCLKLGGAGVHGFEYGANTQRPAQTAYAFLTGKFRAKCSDLPVGKPVVFGGAQEFLGEHRGVDKLGAEVHQGFKLGEEPGVNARGGVYLVHSGAEPECEFGIVDAALGGAFKIRKHGAHVGGAVARECLVGDSPEPCLFVFQRAHDFAQRSDVVAAERHGFTDGFHGGGEGVIGTGEFFKGEAWGFDHHIIQRGFEGSWCDAGDVVGDFVEGVADGELRGDFGDGESRRLGCQRRGPGHTGVHLDGDQAAIAGVNSELDVAATSIHTHFTQNGETLVTHDLELAVGQRHGGCHGHGVTGVHTQRIHIFDGTHHHAVVVGIAHEFQLVFFPAENGLFDEHIGFG